MKKTCSRFLALGTVLVLTGTVHAGTPGVTALLLPQLFGQDSASAPSAQRHDPEPEIQDVVIQVKGTRSACGTGSQPACPKSESPRKRIVVSTAEMDEDEDCLADLIWDGVSACRMILVPTRYEGVGALLEVLARVAADKYAQSHAANVALPVAPGCPRQTTAAAPCCEVLPCPRVVRGPCCPTACDTPACCADMAKNVAADTACKCCASCKDCPCGKKAGAGMTSSRGICGSIVINERNFAIEPAPMPSVTYFPPQRQPIPPTCQPLMMHLLPPPSGFHPMPNPVNVPPGSAYFDMPHTMLPPPPPPELVRELMGEAPPCLAAELQELVHQREMIAHAIEQIQQEMARIAQQKQIEQTRTVSATPNAQKVHLVTTHFEAHCDSLSPVGNAPHCMVLQGNVRLTCKKGSNTVHINAPCITINVQDGTFNVDQPAPVSCPVGVQPAVRTGAVEYIRPSYPYVGTTPARQNDVDKDDK